MKKIIFLIFIIFPLNSFAQTLPLPLPTSFEVIYPTIQGIFLPSLPTVYERPEIYINYIYRVSIILGTVLAFFSFLIGAFLYLASAGNISRQIEARERILGALLGVLILISSFLLLRLFNPEFLRLNLASLRYPYTEIEEGVWLCNREIEEVYQIDNRDFHLTFEIYIQSRLVLKNIWDSLDIRVQRAIHNLYYNVHNNCLLILSSQDIPEKFRNARHVYIIGNYGIILHALSNFKGPIRMVRIEERLLNLDLFDPEVQINFPSFSYFRLQENEVPNFSITLFKDFRLNYLDKLFGEIDARYRTALPNYSENIQEYAEVGTTTFYTFRNFHEDLPPKYQISTTSCPSFRSPGTQNCFRSFEFKIEDFATTVPWSFGSFSSSLGILNSSVIQVRLDPSYSFKIILPKNEKLEGKQWWLLIVRGFLPSPQPSPPPDIPYRVWIISQPWLWEEIFDKEDRDLEDNYVSYFCEDKAKHKRYPCIDRVEVIPGRLIKEVEK
jgi:hypothetical protein